MSLLGFDAIGRLPLGTIPEKSGKYLLAGLAGSYALTGHAATFKTVEAGATGVYLETGNAAIFASSFHAVGTSYAETGHAATFLTKLGGAAGSFAVSGFPTGALVMVAFRGTFAVTGFPANETTLEALGSASYRITGSAANLVRDFVNWFPATIPQASTWNNDAAPSSVWYSPEPDIGFVFLLGADGAPLLGPDGAQLEVEGDGTLPPSWTNDSVPVSSWVKKTAPSTVWANQ